MQISIHSAFGWPNCLRLSNSAIELVVTTDVGPRILDCHVPARENVLRVYAEQTGHQHEPDYQVRGGHRIWVSPETKLTYTPDNSSITVEQPHPGTVRLINPATAAA